MSNRKQFVAVGAQQSVYVNDFVRWFLENGLLLNPDKTEAVLFSTSAQRKKIPTAGGIDVTGTVHCNVPFRDTADGPALWSAVAAITHVRCVISDRC